MLRRNFLILSGRALLAAPAAAQIAARTRVHDTDLVGDLAAIERRIAGRLGVASFDAVSERHLLYRGHERFPMCSTFKWLLAAQVLSRVDRGHEHLSRVISYGPSDLLEYAPLTRQHVAAGGMTIAALAEAAVEYSDNTATNLLLGTVGGPHALTRYARTIGDRVTRLDRTEPDLNSAQPGDPRDTTTPAAMLADLRRILLGDGLAPASRAQLLGWLRRCTTGNEKLRAGVPSDWQVGDKTGMGAHGSTNDVAILWPPGHAPVLVAVYLTETDADVADRNAALTRVAQVIVRWTAGSAQTQR
jgi:beta-lactamase class A